MPYLAYQDKLRAVGPGALTIGSGTEASWRILNQDLEPVHVVVTLGRDGTAHISRGSRNAAVLINGREMDGDAGLLRYGDTLRLNRVEMLYRQAAQDVAPSERYLRDTRRGRSFKLSGPVQIGRDPKCGIVIPEPEVSRVHAEIEFDGRRYYVRPAPSAYSVLNGERVVGRTPLSEGDELGIGRTVMLFSTEPGPYRASETGEKRVPAAAAGRGAQMQTIYMGAIQARERVERAQRRRITLAVILVVLAALLAYAILTR